MKAHSYQIPVFIYRNTRRYVPEYKQLRQCEHVRVPYHNQSHNVNTILFAVPGNLPYLLNTKELSVFVTNLCTKFKKNWKISAM